MAGPFGCPNALCREQERRTIRETRLLTVVSNDQGEGENVLEIFRRAGGNHRILHKPDGAKREVPGNLATERGEDHKLSATKPDDYQRARARGFTSIRATIGKDNKASAEVHPVAFDGKPHQTTGGDAREISYKQIDANTIERTQNRDGKISMDTEQVSPDGKTLTVTQAGVVRVYDKQFNVQTIGH